MDEKHVETIELNESEVTVRIEDESSEKPKVRIEKPLLLPSQHMPPVSYPSSWRRPCGTDTGECICLCIMLLGGSVLFGTMVAVLLGKL